MVCSARGEEEVEMHWRQWEARRRKWIVIWVNEGTVDRNQSPEEDVWWLDRIWRERERERERGRGGKGGSAVKRVGSDDVSGQGEVEMRTKLSRMIAGLPTGEERAMLMIVMICDGCG
jgi:hypothetical protein